MNHERISSLKEYLSNLTKYLDTKHKWELGQLVNGLCYLSGSTPKF